MWNGRTLVSYPSYDQTSGRFVSSIIKGKMVGTNFADENRLNLSCFDMDFFEGPSDNFNSLIDYENVNIK